ncbi:MAG: response regulator, partial [Planctomycetota bacterium]
VLNEYKLGESLVGQAALEKQRILLTRVPDDYIKIGSGLGDASPTNIVVLPVVFEDQVNAVIELASFEPFTDVQLTFLEQLAETIGIVVHTIAGNTRTEELLKQSQALTEELQGRQAELTKANQQLEEQTRSLTASEELLKKQREELRATNAELEEKAGLLAEQKAEVERKKQEVESAKRALEEKAEQLALTSKYKSEFLANMSHELRTPLNSMLILSKILADNQEATLTTKQTEFAKTIHSSGSDLLELINDILDLSKIESGTVEVYLTDVRFREVRDFVERTFRQVAEQKSLGFEIELGRDLPGTMQTDSKRLQQVIKNLLSNAFKFTEKGKVQLKIERAQGGWTDDQTILREAGAVIAFSVTDTGIGISQDKHQIIFEAFQQADGTTSRKYGGTGLGLSISREIAQLLGGQIRLESEPGKGSTFTLFVPLTYKKRTTARPATAPTVSTPQQTHPAPTRTSDTTTPVPGSELDDGLVTTELVVADDRGNIQPGDRTLLIVEDDIAFANILLDLAREKRFKGLVATRGESALALAREHSPDAITLDLLLPDVAGWAVLDRLKHDPHTRHIPVHIISGEEAMPRALQLGAMGYLPKPIDRDRLGDTLTELHEFIDRKVKNLLVVEDDDVQRLAICELIGEGDVQTTAVGSAEEALAAIEKTTFDCMILDLKLPDLSGFELVDAIKTRLGDKRLPIIVYTGKELTPEEETRLKMVSESIIVKNVKAPERLLAETALFLHRVEANLPDGKRKLLQQLQEKDPVLVGKKVLVVDDDVRNIFALTSVLERQSMRVLFAENGKQAIDTLDGTPDIDVVLMDVMMPEMDGYETTRAIRSKEQFRQLPIITVTAKAMKDDREKSIESGASDYITKPVDTEQLLSLLRVWLFK